VTALHAAPVNPVSRVFLDAGINDRDDLDALLAQIGSQPGQVKLLPIPGEAAEALHVVNI
jgi:hypothetical protein